MKSVKNLVKGGAWVVLSTLVTRFAGLVALPILARLLGPSDLGLYNLIANTVQTGDGLSRLGTDAAIHRNGSQFKTIGTEAVGRLFGVGAVIILVAGTAIALCLWTWRHPIALQWLGEPRSESWLGLASIVILLNAISNPPWYYLLALHEFRISSLRSSGVAIAGTFITLVLASQFKFTGALLGLGATALLQAAWGWWLTVPILRNYHIKLRFDHFLSETRSILNFGLPFYASNFLSGFITLPLLGYVSRTGGIEQLGYLRVAQSISQLISFLPTAIAPVIISTLSSSFSEEKDEFLKIKSLHLRSLWLLILWITTVICFCLPYLVRSLFGEGYNQAIFLSRLTVWTAAISSLSSILSQYMISAGKTKSIAVIQTISLFIVTLLSILLISHYSSIGLLTAQVLGVIFTTLAYIKPALKDVLNVNRFQIICLGAASFILAFFSFIPSAFHSPQSSLLITTATFSIFLLALLPLTVFASDERIIFVAFIKKSFKTL